MIRWYNLPMHAASEINVLLVEDDRKLAGLTRQYLENHQVSVTVAQDGGRGLRLALSGDFDVVLLDLMLPGMDGMDVCRRLRMEKNVPVIMITARGEEADRVMGLELGADDYLPKPFSPRELLARIRAVVRRYRQASDSLQDVLCAGGLRMTPSSYTAELNGRLLDLTSHEFSMLYALVKHAGRVLDRDRLMDITGAGSDAAFDRSIDVHISRLRKKLDDDPRNPRMIRTVRGVGYMFLAGSE